MNCTLNKFIIFAAGAAIGSVVTWKFLKIKYERIAQEDIESIRDFYANKSKDEKKPVVETHSESDEMTEILKQYDTASTSNDKPRKEGKKYMNEPRVITPEEFGERDDFETVSLTYYADGILTDEDDQPIEDVDYLVGTDSLTYFGEYEEDSVFVRNEDLETDYEILRDSRNYYDTNTED